MTTTRNLTHTQSGKTGMSEAGVPVSLPLPVTPPLEIPATVAVLLTAMRGPSGTTIFKEALRSFVEMKQVTEVYVADLATVARSELSGGLEGVTRLPASAIHIVHTPDMYPDEALNVLVNFALRGGHSHAVIGRSHERLIRKTPDVGMVESLPNDWASLDILQVVSNVRYRPLADVFVRLSAFRFTGRLFPAPTPLGTRISITARAWDGVELAAIEAVIPRKALAAVVDSLATVSDQPLQYILGMLMLKDPGRMPTLMQLLQARIEDGEDGWGGDDGLFFAKRTLASLTQSLTTAVDAAETGLALDRFDGVHVLSVLLKASDAPLLGALLTSAASGALWRAGKTSLWMSVPSASSFAMLSDAGTHMYCAGRKTPAHACFVAAYHSPGSASDKKVAQKYKFMAGDGDEKPVRACFPLPHDFIVPTLTVVDGAVKGDLGKLVGSLGVGDRVWLGEVLQTLVHAPCVVDVTYGPIVQTVQVGQDFELSGFAKAAKHHFAVYIGVDLVTPNGSHSGHGSQCLIHTPDCAARLTPGRAVVTRAGVPVTVVMADEENKDSSFIVVIVLGTFSPGFVP